MEKIRDDQVCEIVADLLPSYLEGECGEACRKLVETHLEECERCRELTKAMQTDFTCMKEKNEQEKAEDQREIDALRRVKRRSRIRTAVIAVVVAVCVALGAVAVSYLTGNGLSIRNRTARQEAEKLLQLWKEDGTEAFVNQMEPRTAYETLCTPKESFFDESEHFFREASGNQIPSRLEVTFPEGDPEQNYVIEDIDIIQDLMDDGESYSTIGEKIYQEEDLDAYVHWIMSAGETEALTDSDCDYILTEQDYLRLKEKYGPIEDPWISILEVNGKTYYYRTSLGKEKTGEYAENYLEEFTEDMRRVVPEIEDLDPLYVYIARSGIVPEELWQIKEDTLEKIRGWYEKYAAYYKDMGYETFREGWRNHVVAELERILGENGKISDVSLGKSRGYDVWQSGDLNDPENTSWNMIWDVTCAEGSFCVYLNVEEDGSDPWLYAFRDDRVEFTSFDPLIQW